MIQTADAQSTTAAAPAAAPQTIPAKKKGDIVLFLHVPMAQKIFFLDHLRVMLGAGLSVVEALRILKKEISNKNLRDAATAITADVEKGEELSVALSKHEKIFAPMYVQMVSAGEMAGKLEESLAQIVSQMKRAHEIASNIRGAMMYPSVVVGAIIAIGGFMSFFVLPQLVALFDEFDSGLPLPTRILIAVSKFTSNPVNMGFIAAAFVGLIILHFVALKKSAAYRKTNHALLLKLPIVGHILKQVNLARFSLTLSSMLKSTIPIIDATRITSDVCGNVLYKESLLQAAQEMKEGKPLSDILHLYPHLYPPMVTEMILVGEKTGEVESLLEELSNFYSNEVDHTMKNFTTIIEPVIIVFLGVAVGGIAIAIIMPMYSLVQQF